MTANQINYQKNVEQRRTNIANELLRGSELAETTRHNKRTEDYTERHYDAQDALGFMKFGEDQRHNLASEQLGQGNLQLGYGNLALGQANLGLGYSQLAELIRHNQSNESISQDSNLVKALASGKLPGYLYAATDARFWDRVGSTSDAAQSKLAELLDGYSAGPKEGSIWDGLKSKTWNAVTGWFNDHYNSFGEEQ